MWRVKAAYGAAVLALVAGGVVYIQAHYAEARARALRELSGIAELREDQVSAWRAAQLRAGSGLIPKPRLSDGIFRFVENPAADDAIQEVQSHLTSYLPYVGFSDASIVDGEGRTLRRLIGETTPTVPAAEAAALEAWRSGQPVMSQIYPAPAGDGLQVCVAVPFIAADGARAAVILECDPADELYPILQSWPFQTESAESYLVSRRDAVAMILSPLRHLAGGGLGMELSLERTDIAAVQAVEGDYQVKRGLDYRGVPVYSASVAVPGSPWIVVAEIDESEAMAEVWRDSATAIALVVALFAALLATGAAVWEFSLKARFAAMYEAEHLVARSSRLYDMLSHTNSLITRIPPREELLEAVCRIAVERGGFLFAWYGELTPDGSVRPVCRAGDDGGFVDEVNATIDERSERGAGCTGQALRNSVHYVCNDFLTDVATSAWHGLAKRVGIRSSAAFPVRENGKVAGAFMFYSSEAGFFTEADIATLDEMASDVSFAIENFRRNREREEAVANLAELNDRLNQYFSVSPVVTYVLNVNGDSTTPHWISENVREFLGFEPEEALDPAWWDRNIHPDDRELAHRALAEVRTEGQVQGEYRIRRKDGRVVWLWEAMRLIGDDAGAPARVVGAWSDVTERKRAEEALRIRSASLEAVANAVTITDRDGFIEWVNPALTELTGYTLEECIGRRPQDLVRCDNCREGFFDDVWAVVRAGGVWRGEFMNRRKDGAHFTVEATITPVKDEQGRTTHYIGVEQDITKRKQLEEEFRQAQKMESIGRLAGGIAHDFNNLLNVISGNAELALAALDADAPIREDLKVISDASAQAAKLTRQLLAFSRKQVLKPETVDVDQTIRNLERMVSRVIGEHIRLELDLADTLGPILVDPGQFEQVIMNLLVNARDAMPQGGAITIRTAPAPFREGASEGAYIRISVADTGVGMDDDLKLRVFEPFFTTKPEGRGTGLGLSTVYGIVQQSGGFIEVESEPGRGTVFLIDLPRHEGPAAPASATFRTAQSSPNGHETILVVEDEPALRHFIERSLALSGFTVLVAEDAVQALEIVERVGDAVDLLLTDVIMPGMSGPRLAERLLASRPKLKVLFMSGYTDDSLAGNGGLDPAKQLINKPFTGRELADAIRRVLSEEPSATTTGGAV